MPVTIGLFDLNFYGMYLLLEKLTLNINEINSIDKYDIWAFDRRAVLQSYSHSRSDQARTISDIGLWTSYCLPGLLFIDSDFRNDWSDILLLYFEIQAINFNIYVWGGPIFTKRIRPIVYYEKTDWEYKSGNETTDSFFSGHVSMAAGASFFMAKVYSDYHPELGEKKYWLYTAALIPPAFVGY